ncbi:MAG: hypothetical protein WC893_00885 [Candidatus Paceibacterota bacterium]|jgi:hypothetical protein
MTNDNKQNDPELKKKLAAARLAMSPEEEKKEWQSHEDYLSARKKEAAAAMISNEQKTLLEEEVKAREERLQKQKKIEALESLRQKEEKKRKKQLAEEQKKQYEEAETERVKKIEKILESKAEIKGLIKQGLGKPKTIRTLRDDIAETVKRDRVTASKIIIQEKAMRQAAQTEATLQKKRKRSNIIIFISLVLVFLGLSSVIFVWWQKREEKKPSAPIIKESLIFSDRLLKIDITNLSDRESLKNAQKKEYKKLQDSLNENRGVSDLYFTKNIQETVGEKIIEKTLILTASDYLEKATLVTDDFSRFASNDFMVGFLGYNRISPFFVFKTNDYKHFADALLLAGKPIITELFSVFWDNDKKELARGSLFQDLTLKNYDLRILKSVDNESIAGYVFLDKKTLLIFETEEDFLKILDAFLITRPVTR